MFIIECLPFSKGLNKDSLTYFSTEHLEPGSLIKVSLRNKSVPALVLESRDAQTAKAEIKTADFRLKKISNIAAKPFLESEFFAALRQAAEYFASSPGSLLTHLIPAFITQNPGILSAIKPKQSKPPKPDTGSIQILQTDEDERFVHYRSLIREEFAKKKSVFFCLSQNQNLEQAKERLERGIESFVCVFHSDMSDKDLKKEWKKACDLSHPVLIIASPRWLFIPRADLGSIILEEENQNGWKALSRPFMDFRVFAEILAKAKGIKVILGGTSLRVETLHRFRQHEIGEFEHVKWRMPPQIETAVIDLKETAKRNKAGPDSAGKQEFKTLSKELIGLAKDSVSRGAHLFIFAARKGLSSVIVCRDCGEQVKCGNCGAPVVLYKTKDGGIFKCHQCGETRDAAEVCQSCGSWRLAAYGAGIDRVTEEIRKEIPGATVFEIHKDLVSTGARATKITENFYASKGSILIGTEMALPYLHKRIAYSAIASFDPLFFIPDFRIREKIFNIILQTRDLAKERCLVQTRNAGDPTVGRALEGNIMEFYKEEVEDRRSLGYPPFGLFVKVTVRGSRNQIAKETENLKSILVDYEPAVFNSIHEKRGEQAAVNAVIKLSRNAWPEDELLSLLRSLPPQYEIKVDPDSLL